LTGYRAGSIICQPRTRLPPKRCSSQFVDAPNLQPATISLEVI
jgi:hypothetical protein